MDYNEAIKLFENGDAKECIQYFEQSGNLLELGYSYLLLGDFTNAETIFKKTNSYRADWALKLIPIMKKKIGLCPSYFQIRNFLEPDLTLLFTYNRIEFINNILYYAKVFQEINNESYKYFGRALLKNNFPNEAKIFFDKSLDMYYNDVELHYLFVEYYLLMNDYANAKRAVDNCLKINENYYPAKRTKAELQKL